MKNIGGLNQFSATDSKPHTFSTFSGEEKEKDMSIHSFKQGH